MTAGVVAGYTPEPPLADVQRLPGATVLEFGTGWCGVCRATQPAIVEALAACTALAPQPALRHLKIEDGPGRPLGRHYRVKLWPTMVLLHNGQEVARLVRPSDAASITQALQALQAMLASGAA